VHRLSTSFILGYHGCDRSVAERVLAGAPFKPSENAYDWLGSGIYFWESNPARGLDWAHELQMRHKGTAFEVKEPTVIGAVIDLGYCLDLASDTGIQFVKAAHADFVETVKTSGREMPKNSGGPDLLQRNLDCAVINHIHFINRKAGKNEFETVRGIFLEGRRIYEDAGFFEKTHIQICVRNSKNIKGVFRVNPDED
jgi:hypothetical protein